MRVALATLLTLLLAVMLFSCDVDNTPVEVEEDSSVADAAPSLDRLVRSAKVVDAKALGGIDAKLVKLDSLLPAPLAKIDLYSQLASSDGLTRKYVFAPGETFCMSLFFSIREPGTVGLLYMWLGAGGPVVFTETGPQDFWWDVELTEAGMYGFVLTLGGGAPSLPGDWNFLGAVKYMPRFGLLWRGDWGFFAPTPHPFTITPP